MKSVRHLLLPVILLVTAACAAQQKIGIHLKSGFLQPSKNINASHIGELNREIAKSGQRTQVLLQFEAVPSQEQKRKLSAAGIELLRYIPDYAYTASVSSAVKIEVLQAARAKAIVKLSAKDKMEESLARQQVPSYAIKVPGAVDLRLSFIKTITAAQVIQQLKQMDFQILSTDFQQYRVLDVRAASNRLAELAGLYFVEYVQPVPPLEEPLNNKSRSGSRANVLNAPVINGGKGLNGEGVVIGVGDNANVQLNIDFAGRLLTQGGISVSAHGTHVTGTAAGAGIINELYRGYAPKSKIVSQFFSNVIAKAPTFFQDYGMVLTNNSYGGVGGCNGFGTYDVTSGFMDQQAIELPYVLNVFAAGNSGANTCSPYPAGFRTVLGGFQSSKNLLSVGNTTDSGLVITASSKGPVKDGRLKPDLVAMGTNVWSNWATNFYIPTTGTSMAAPAVTGGLALLYQRYRQLNGGANPKSGLMKAIICNGAADRGNAGPDFSYGFGWMNLLRSVEMLDNHHYYSGSSTQSSISTANINVPANTAQLKVMLYWHDPAASPISSKALVNDLDLSVVTPGASTVLPQILDTSVAGITVPATTGIDRMNNMEQVIINQPTAGTYEIKVNGSLVAENPSQEFFIVYDIVPVSVKLTYPVGGEGWVPDETVQISWDAYGNTDKSFTLQYSTDNGSSWNTIATGIDAARRIYSWQVPNTVTHQALVRIVQDVTGVSSTSNSFAIVGVPVVSLSSTQCEGYLAISWPAVSGATEYLVSRFYGDEMMAVATTNSNSYMLSGLSPDSVYWVGVTAMVNGKPGRRSVAVSRQPNSGSCSGSISDNDLKLQAIISPTNGRKFTSTELTAASSVRVQVKNLDDVAISNFDLKYSLNGGSWVTETISSSIAPGAVYDHSFATPVNLASVGNYSLSVVVKNTTADPVSANDTLSTTIRHLDNTYIDLSSHFLDNLETSVAATYNFDTIGLRGIDRYDFQNSLPSGELKTFVNTGHAYSGTKNFTMASNLPPTGGPYSTNYTIGTFNLNGYDAAVKDLRLDFRYLLLNQSGAANRVWIRGNDTQTWKEVFNLDNNPSGNDYKLSPSIELSDSLMNAGQNFSSSFQVRWGQNAVYPETQGITYRLDDIHLYEVMHDMQMLRIDSPLTINCGLSNAVPLVVTLHNSYNSPLANIPVKYSINNGTWVEETIGSLAGNTSLQYSFAQKMNLSAAGMYNIRAVVNYPTDNFRANDTVYISIHNAPLVTSFPYLQNFETGDGGFYADGNNSSWAYGTPAAVKINKAASGTKGWKTNLTGNYNDLERSYLYSPCFNTSSLSKPTLSFSVALDLEDCGSVFCDGGWIEYSADGGSWTKLDTSSGLGTNWYNSTSFKAWSINDYTRWHVVTVPLPTTASQLRFRFVMSADEAINYEGIAIDDIHVYDNTKGIYDGVTMASPVSQGVSGNNWVDFESGGKLVASVHPNGQDLGNTSAQVFIHSGAVRHTSSQYYHNRNITIKPATTSLSDSATVRFYFLDSETEALLFATACADCSKPTSAYNLGVSKYSDMDDAFENGTIGDNNQGLWAFITSPDVKKVPFDKGYYAEFKAKDFSEFWLNNGGLNGNATLPVKLLDFTVQKTNTSDDVLLKWITESETNIRRYEIELARGVADLQANRFVKIADEPSQGNSASTQTYTYLDTEPAKFGARYYRLKIIEQDGSFTYSPIRSVVFDEAVTWQVFPNPSSGLFNLVYLVSADEMLEANLFDAKGRLIKQYKQKGTGFLQKLSIDLTDQPFASGIYLLQTQAGGKRQSFRLYKH